MEKKSHVQKIVMTAMMMCLVIIATVFIRVPIPGTQGYVHLGDSMVFLSVLILGWKYGIAASAFGGMLADVLGGAAAWAPWTFCIKGIMALILGLVAMKLTGSERITKSGFIFGEVLGMILAGIFMTVGYYFAEGFMYGNWVTPVIGIPWNIGQFAVGMVIASVLAGALCKTPAKSFFAYKLKTRQNA